MAKRKKTNNDLQNITQKNKDRVTRSHKNHGDTEGCTAPATIVTFTPVMLLCGDMSIMRKGWNFDYDKRNIPTVISTQIFHSCSPSHGGDRKASDVITYPT